MIKKILIGVVCTVLATSAVQAKIKIGKSIAATAIATSATKVLAQDSEEYIELIQKFSDEDLVALLKSEGYGGASIKREGLIRIKIDGRSYLMYNSKRGDLQMYYGIGGTKVSYKDVNQWNYEKKYSKAYLDNDMDVALEFDLEAEAGLTRRQILEFLDTFIGSVQVFRNFVMEHDKS